MRELDLPVTRQPGGSFVSVLSPDKREVTLLAVNRSLESDLTLEIDTSAFGTVSPLEWLVLNHAELKAQNTQPNRIEVQPSRGDGLEMCESKLCARPPKASWNVIRCTRAT